MSRFFCKSLNQKTSFFLVLWKARHRLVRLNRFLQNGKQLLKKLFFFFFLFTTFLLLLRLLTQFSQFWDERQPTISFLFATVFKALFSKLKCASITHGLEILYIITIQSKYKSAIILPHQLLKTFSHKNRNSHFNRSATSSSTIQP